MTSSNPKNSRLKSFLAESSSSFTVAALCLSLSCLYTVIIRTRLHELLFLSYESGNAPPLRRHLVELLDVLSWSQAFAIAALAFALTAFISRPGWPAALTSLLALTALTLHFIMI